MTMEHITSNNLLFLFVLYKLETYGILTTCRKRKEIISKSKVPILIDTSLAY